MLGTHIQISLEEQSSRHQFPYFFAPSVSTMSVKDVPSEVWIQTFGHLSKQDLKAIRLSGSHYLGSLASSLLFTTAYIAARPAVLNTFLTLTTHPEFCDYVKEIVFDSSYINVQALMTVLHDDDENQKCGSSLARLFKKQHNIYDKQLQNALDVAFKPLSNVTGVRYADMSRVAILPGDCDCSSWERHDYQEEPLIHRIDSASSETPQFFECRVKSYVACRHYEDNDKFM